jgi:major membrane immunogen (membrane-anchored lipoprotein)
VTVCFKLATKNKCSFQDENRSPDVEVDIQHGFMAHLESHSEYKVSDARKNLDDMETQIDKEVIQKTGNENHHKKMSANLVKVSIFDVLTLKFQYMPIVLFECTQNTRKS